MASVTHAGSSWTTSNSPTTHTVTATPAANDLIVVVHGGSGFASGDTSVITDNNSGGGGTYTILGSAVMSSGGGTDCALWISIRDSLVSSATSTVFTNTEVGLSGGGLTVFRVSGMSRTGSSAARQFKGESTQTENPPSITFNSATLTDNPIILAVAGEDNPPALTAPTDFSESFDSGYSTPTSGFWVGFINSGKTSTTYTWSGGAVTDHNEAGVELDTSAAESTGTGALSAQASTVSGSGVSESTGTGALQAGGSSVSGSGVSESTGSGTLVSGTATISGQDAGESTGTGELVAGVVSIGGAGISGSEGLGSLLSQASTIAGSGVSSSDGSGNLVATHALVVGSGASSSIGSGALQSQSSRVSGFDVLVATAKRAAIWIGMRIGL